MDLITHFFENIENHYRGMTTLIFVIAMLKLAMPLIFYVLHKMQDHFHNKKMLRLRKKTSDAMLDAGYSQQQIADYFEAIKSPNYKAPSLYSFMKKLIKKYRSAPK